tara:strand:- start:382 stop:765 length:384 start_codon:yes stop_codon:yes gene_type:complete
MNCLKVDPELLVKRIDSKLRDTNYDFLDILNDYNISPNIYYDFLLGIDDYKLKNVWNHVIIRWNQMKLSLKDNKKFKMSDYSKKNYYQNHNNISDEVLNKLFNEFISNSPVKCFFVANCIQNYIYPK